LWCSSFKAFKFKLKKDFTISWQNS
jgi:hypothetical protein